MELYLNSTGIISGAGNEMTAGRLLCKEPDYSGYIAPMQLRRMSKAVRIGIGASKMCMENAGIEKPDAISIGTAMGCLADTELFLTKMVEQNEQMLTPTAFIQSTHNTVSGQIALLAGCYGHNLTFVQRGHSFEHALINAQLYLDEHKDEKMLVGGIDELTENSYKAFKSGGVYNDDVVAGEGAAFFIATSKPMNDTAVCIKDIYCFTADNADDAVTQVISFKEQNNIANIDLLLSGRDTTTAKLYDKVAALFNTREETFKQKCGEYPTASSYALGMLLQREEKVKRSVVVNHFKHYYACWLVESI
ncbi:MAG: beta-ketoacyl synthase chain length factor [Bacteroidetes bacterium]|nr:beta-ketoacyl synthase chain length factor [Bacteroidota bacterium]